MADLTTRAFYFPVANFELTCCCPHGRERDRLFMVALAASNPRAVTSDGRGRYLPTGNNPLYYDSHTPVHLLELVGTQL